MERRLAGFVQEGLEPLHKRGNINKEDMAWVTKKTLHKVLPLRLPLSLTHAASLPQLHPTRSYIYACWLRLLAEQLELSLQLSALDCRTLMLCSFDHHMQADSGWEVTGWSAGGASRASRTPSQQQPQRLNPGPGAQVRALLHSICMP